jgi:photosystem II stability/assembly factor-like uncharacterized protein
MSVSGLISNSRLRRWRAFIVAGVGAAVLSLAVAGCVSAAPGGRDSSAGGPAGAANVLATSEGVVWSFDNQGGSGVVLRSADGGRHWRVALRDRAQGSSFGLVASYFLGSQHAWAVGESPGGISSVYRTSDGGQRWQRAGVPAAASLAGPVLFEQIVFAGPLHGWLLGVAGGGSSLAMVWWRTDDGGRRWTGLPAGGLPLQGLRLASYGKTPCPTFSPPHLAFATARTGWFTEGACEHGPARPVVWRTGDGGRRWVPSALPAPAGGWGRWDVLDGGGTDVGAPYLLGSPGGSSLLVPVAEGTSRLVVERSVDGGRTWRIAATVGTRALPLQTTPADWFDPVDARRWVLAAPGGLIETADAGRTWSSTRSGLALSGQPVSFTSLDRGFRQGSGLVAAVRTTDGGRTWTREQGPGPRAELAAQTLGPAVSTIERAGPQLAVAAGPAGLETSTSNGRSWVRRLGVSSPVRQVDFVGRKVGFAVGDGELLRSTDGGVSWQRLLEPAAGAVSSADFWSPAAGVVAVGQALLVTSDGGGTWRPLRLPSGWSVAPTLAAGDAPAAVCFTGNGVGWAAATRGGRYEVLVSLDGGRSWRVALASTALPAGSQPGRPAGAVSIAGCSGDAGWVLVAQAAGPGNTAGVPVACDLLRSPNLGRSWLDVLRSASSSQVTRPNVPQPPGGPQPAPAGNAAIGPLTVQSPATAWFDAGGENSGGLTFGSTGDGGLRWAIHSSPAAQTQPGTAPAPRQLPVEDQLLATTALDSSHAWLLFGGPKGHGDSYLYATNDAGEHWHRITVFGWSR